MASTIKIIQNFLDEIYHKPESRMFIVVNDVLVATTLVSILAVILETVSALDQYTYLFNITEYTAVAIFTVEYITRIIASRKKGSYVFSFFGVIDLLAIIPTYLSLGNLTFLKAGRALRILRFLRILRLAKVARIQMDDGVDAQEYEQLYRMNIKIYFAALFSAVILIGSLIYIIEGNTEAFSNVPKGMLWAIQMLISMGAQDTPQSLAGTGVMVLAQFISLLLLGIALNIVGKTVNYFIFGTKDFYYDKADD